MTTTEPASILVVEDSADFRETNLAAAEQRAPIYQGF